MSIGYMAWGVDDRKGHSVILGFVCEGRDYQPSQGNFAGCSAYVLVFCSLHFQYAYSCIIVESINIKH